MVPNRTMECIEIHGPEDEKAQNALYNKIKRNTIDPSAKSSTAEKIRALNITLKELAEDRFSIVSQIEKNPEVKMTGSRSAYIQERIAELQSAIDAPDVHENTKARYEKQLEQLLESTRTPDTSSPVMSGSTNMIYETNKGSWKKVVKDNVEIYNQGNAVIKKEGDRKWIAMKKDSDGNLKPYGDNFKSMRDAIQALNEDKTSAEFYPAKVKAAQEPLTDAQSKLLEGVPMKKYSEMVVNTVPELKGDPEALGVAEEGIMDAARKWNPEKAGEAQFSTYSFKYARGKVLDYYKHRSEVQSMEVSSNTIGEEGETETKIENVSKRQMASVPKQNKVKTQTEAEMKGPPAPIKKIEASDAEKKAIMDSIEEKRNRSKKVEGSEITAKAEVVKKEAKVEEGAIAEDLKDVEDVDESPTVIIRRPKSKFVDTTVANVKKEQTEEVKETNEILKRTKWNKEEAIRVASSIRDTVLRQKVISQINSIQQNTIGGILQQTLANSTKDSKTHKLAGFLSSLLSNPSKRSIKVVVDPSLSDAYFDPNTGVVYLTDTTTDLVGLHEVQHAITSRELELRPDLKARVRAAMNAVKESIVNDPTVKITKADIKRLEGTKGTSASFKKEFGSESFKGDSGILYALVNEKEFLAQAFNDSRVQEIFMNIEAPKGSGFKSMFDYIVQLFLDIFGQTKIKNNVMREVLQLTAELSKVDLRYGKISETLGVDGILGGALSETANINKMQNAIDRISRGEDAEAVRRSTGWYHDIDGEWKYEISDKDASFLYRLQDLDTYNSLTFSNRGKYKLGDIFEHSKLFEAYPELLDVDVTLSQNVGTSKKSRGSYNPNTNTISLKQSETEAQLRKTILHEIQHWVQYKENFSVGGNVETIRLTEVVDKMQDLYTLERSNAEDRGDIKTYETLTDSLKVLEEVRENKVELNRIYDTLASSRTNLDGRMQAKRAMGALFSDTKALTAVMYDTYHLIAGEAEARNVAKRSDLSAKERANTPLYDTNDINPEYAIVHKIEGQVEALDMQDEARVEKTWDQRADIMMKNDVNSTKIGVVKEFITKKVYPYLKDKAVSTTERLRELAPGIMGHVREFEFKINKYNAQYHEEAKEYVDKYKKIPLRDQKILDQALRNNYPEDVEKRWEILKKYNMTKAYEKVVVVLKDIQKRKLQVSLGKYQEIPDYWPRKVKDLMALMQTMQGDPNFGVIEAELRRAGLNKADREIAIQNMIHTGRYPALALLKPGSDKNRTIKRVSSEWAHHYETSVDALINHIYESNEAIEARNMFGDVTRAKLVQDRDDLYKKLETLKGDKEREAVVGKITNIEASLSNYEEDWKEGISKLLRTTSGNDEIRSLERDHSELLEKLSKATNLVDRNKIQRKLDTNSEKRKILEKSGSSAEGEGLSAPDQIEIVSLIRARLLQKGMTGVPAFFRNVALMTVLNGPTAAVTQLADLVISVHANGLKNTGGSLFGNRVISTKDLDLSHSMRDFQTGGSAKWLDRVLWASGLKFMDTFGKNIFMNSAILKSKKQSLSEFTKQWGEQLGSRTEDTWNELKSGEKTDLTRFFAFNALSEWQPVSMSEMPKGYLEAENGRIFYALKSFNIKSINNIRREIWYKTREAKSPKERREAIASGVKLVVLMTLAGASADELKDLIMGRDTEFSDHVSNNLLKIGFMNTYMLEQGEKRGMLKTILGDTLLPPTRVVDDVFADIRNLVDGDPDTETTVKFLRSVPWGGLIYAHGTEGAQKTKASQLKKRISDEVKSGAGMSDIRSDMVKYNKMAREMGETVMTYKSIQAMKKRSDKKK